METNYVIQYSDALPAVDFGEVMNSVDECGISFTTYIEGAKGNDPFNICSCEPYYLQAWEKAFALADVKLRGYNGQTRSWYVQEFFRLLGFTFETRNNRPCVCYNGKVLS